MQSARENAKVLFSRGYNCAQSVFSTFAENSGLDRETALMISSSFGGGFAQMREVCGAVSGMFMAMGLRSGYSDPDDKEAKTAFYEKLRAMTDEFRSECGSLNCGELLKNAEDAGREKPCAELVGLAAEITERWLEKLD